MLQITWENTNIDLALKKKLKRLKYSLILEPYCTTHFYGSSGDFCKDVNVIVISFSTYVNKNATHISQNWFCRPTLFQTLIVYDVDFTITCHYSKYMIHNIVGVKYFFMPPNNFLFINGNKNNDFIKRFWLWLNPFI